MFVPFSRTLRALQQDRSRTLLAWGAAALAFLLGWTAWFVFARIAVYVTSEKARVEVGQSAYTVEAPVPGRLLTTSLKLDRYVKVGDVLVELDSTLVGQQLAEASGRYDALRPRLDARREEIAVEEAQRSRVTDQAEKAALAARAKEQEASSSALLAKDEAARAEELHKRGTVPEVEALRTRADARQKALFAEAARLEVGRIERQRESELGEISIRVSRLRSEIVDLDGQVASSKAAVAALTVERDRHVLRAPVTGRIAELAPKQAGAFVQPGERLATLVPEGDLHAVAQFLPAHSVGRIRPGQRGRVRLDGYPWMQFGSLPGRVETVGTEMRDGFIRVEMSLQPEAPTRIPVQHGLTGQAEIAVEEISPLELLLRASGRLITASDGSR